jgi:DnaJ-domain-containing protein 1
MIYLLLGGSAVILLVYLYSLFTQGEIRRMVLTIRWTLGLALLAGAAILALGGRIGLASMLAIAGGGILWRGRLGPIDLGGGMTSPHNRSKVKSQFLAMELDHDTGSVTGEVRAGAFAGRSLADLSSDECWALLDEVGDDPDSLALFESWLDANRAGWREYFSEQYGMDGDAAGARENTGPSSSGPLREEDAYEILGLSPGASPSEIRSAHRALMKKVHPDHGGSAFLAARINEAKDMLLKGKKRSV